MEPIYLDHAAATPLRAAVREAMSPWIEGTVGNPDSVHRWGRAARRAIEGARERIAAHLGTKPETVVFSRGGTESANLALLGRLERVRESLGGGASPPRFLSSGIEHSAVREVFAELAARGAEVGEVAVAADGSFDEAAFVRELSDRAALVSVQWVNHETGLILPVGPISGLCLEAGIPLHVDGVQAAGRVPLLPHAASIHLLTLSAHKLGGPRGIGALVVRGQDLLHPRLFGGGQEQRLRPGTGDVAGAVGFAEALDLAEEERGREALRLTLLRDRIADSVRAAFPDARLHAADGPRAPHILGLGFPGLPRDLLPGALDLAGIGVSAGSACRSGSPEPSPVLRALYGEQYARETAPLRISLGWSTTEDEVARALPVLLATVERVRAAGV